MNRVIKGKRYDTSTAEELGSTQHLYSGDFGYWTETLYRKRTGEFFMYGTGGAASKYREQVGSNEWSGGERITPLDVDEAREWAEEHLTGEEYEEIFGAVEEAGKQPITLSLPAEDISRVKTYAVEHKVTVSDVVSKLIKGL